MSHYRPRRSMLYIPACVPRFLAKGRELRVDTLIFDLEESVLVARKTEARRNAAEALQQGGYGPREVVVRVNRHDSAWGLDDLTAIAPLRPDAILFPRIESGADVHAALAALDAAGGEHLPIMLMLETPLAVLRAEEIAAASKRIRCLVMGTSDLTNELHARITPDRLPILYSMSHCLLAARAHGLPIVDGVYLDMKDMHTFEYACRMARDLGFDGKTVIHPLQIQYANDAFTPHAQSVERARKIIAAFAEANADGRGVTVVDGRLVENLHVEAARRTLMIHAMIEKMETECSSNPVPPGAGIVGWATRGVPNIPHAARNNASQETQDEQNQQRQFL